MKSAFRYEKDIPLVVPEINGECTKDSKLIANPNCTTAIGLMALWPLHKLFKLKSVIMSVSFVISFLKNLLDSMELIDSIETDIPSCVWGRATRNG